MGESICRGNDILRVIRAYVNVANIKYKYIPNLVQFKFASKSRGPLPLPCSFQLIEELSTLKKKETYEKAVVVSQWTSMLDIVAVHLKTMGMRCAEINGEIMLESIDSFTHSYL